MIPTALGNMVGGGLFVGTAYWYLYLTGEDHISVDFNIGSLASTLQAGSGPGRSGPGKNHKEADGETNGKTIHGQDPTAKDLLPHSAGHLMSGIGHELSDDSPYAKTHAERVRSTSSEKEKADERV